MRKLIFRVWHGANKQFYYSDKYKNLSDFFLLCEKCIENGNPAIISQFTGEMAANGDEIFDRKIFH